MSISIPGAEKTMQEPHTIKSYADISRGFVRDPNYNNNNPSSIYPTGSKKLLLIFMFLRTFLIIEY